ncbi:hypothetical protein Pcinc_026573 [Petrolisthes cinctipes]|uniref:Uncharacterized protein n=1 Tax=Petrolisthes cinctipes TaxID=88211 RepID=A0AAE1KA51_PETCI|nr:hypothetical protein Pcinc_026573 [Petrolisthes cinctipes]
MEGRSSGCDWTSETTGEVPLDRSICGLVVTKKGIMCGRSVILMMVMVLALTPPVDADRRRPAPESRPAPKSRPAGIGGQQRKMTHFMTSEHLGISLPQV